MAFARAPECRVTRPQIFEESPARLLEGPENDWRGLLQLFALGHVVWIGDVRESGPGYGRNFRPVSEWLALPRPPGPFTCPSIFKPGAYSRSKENILATPFLVVESDTLTKSEICAVFIWLRQFLRLRAIVDTGGRSLHGWFNYPAPPVMAELKIILPVLGCDPAMFKPSQPCRLPGVSRGLGMQALIYLDTGAGETNGGLGCQIENGPTQGHTRPPNRQAEGRAGRAEAPAPVLTDETPESANCPRQIQAGPQLITI